MSFSFVFSIYKMVAERYEMKRKIQWGTVVFLVLYLLVLAYVCFWSEAYGRTEMQNTYHYNLVPFREIMRFYTYRELVGTPAYVLNLFGNVIAFVPFGLMVPIIHWKYRDLGKVVGLTFLLSLNIECIQLLTRVGSFDVDDLILNTLGGVLGFILFIGMNRIRRRWFGTIK